MISPASPDSIEVGSNLGETDSVVPQKGEQIGRKEKLDWQDFSAGRHFLQS